ncbi:RNA polymerase sigma factor [Methylosinus sporium]|uniref:RNA polymerase subunit sigma-24 n=1 Tax=Methylosinus sporium TaxID=428 RepID=A0A2U1SPU1_METSR|nr:sigma-70 family RNA polymerase sigma factor [Methylosinus sporium]PWB93613.1 RNA polymerase subunit sigma-24 [Methylosinus sporium]
MVDKTTASFRALFMSNRRALLRYLTRRVGRENAPDLLQETFVRLLTRETAAEIVDPPAYLRRTAGNLAKDFARHRALERKIVDADADSCDAASEEPSAEHLVEDAQRRARLAKAVAALPPRCREIFEMRVGQNMSQRDIAATLGISRKTVEQHFRLAMERCRTAIK